MATRDGPGSDHLTHFQRLIDDPQSHHIFLALRIIEARFAEMPRLGRSRRPREDAVRLGQEARMAFSPTTIAQFKPPGAQPGRLTNRFFGFFGPHGPLPIHLTEYARERQINHRDRSFVAFADMLTHRMMSLLYRAWVTGQPAVDFDRGADTGFERIVAAFAGHRGVALRDRDAMPELAKRRYAGLLGAGVKNAEGLVALIAGFFDVRVRLQEFIGTWLELEPDDQWQLGAGGALGQTTSIGNRVWTRNAKFRLVIGPVSLAEYQRLLPGQPSMDRLAAVVRNYVGDALEYDVNIVLRAAEVPQAVLGQGTRLGQTSWLGARRAKSDANDLYLEPQQTLTRAA
ncbi:type VI secretion system baseplate subunit TssG [Sulfitobacter sabulilitoris]|uniref:Type VI secretion system baseplate subunit TssG n=1 Tax=Sulfitobacter sabulilitoris TaxID=2562655 RepID=A0A5S3QAJ7_9RHOB|nr:type VI secretion system baseplate subunit TssG [Sulfitobacter sabulilitoris]TMM54132.1 type VI secretion system baseplate subunit TssG [Sulfitobacter sabulilitoris]